MELRPGLLVLEPMGVPALLWEGVVPRDMEDAPKDTWGEAPLVPSHTGELVTCPSLKLSLVLGVWLPVTLLPSPSSLYSACRASCSEARRTLHTLCCSVSLL